MAAAGNKGEIVRAIFAAYLADDRRTVEQAFADDFRFNTPYGENIDKPRYFTECWRSSDWISRHEIERIMVEEVRSSSPIAASPRTARAFATPSSSCSTATR